VQVRTKIVSEEERIEGKTLGERIKKSRLQAGLTLTQLGETIHSDMWYISRVERDIIVPPYPYRVIKKISDALNVSMKYILGDLLPAGDDLPQMLDRYFILSGKSLQEIADELGVNKGTVYTWKEGNHKPINRYKEKLGELLKITSSH
jgi:transcriptional regulator with XRE-family HTH domain